MEPMEHRLGDGTLLVIREAAQDDAGALLDFVEGVCGESDFLAMGPGEFELTEPEERAFLQKCAASDNQVFLLGLIDGAVAASINFSAGQRPRVRHTGELGMSVRKRYWGRGVGARMLDALIDWARGTGIVKKINLRVRTDNLRAVRLYQGRGFRTEGTIRREVLLHGRYHDCFWMGLEL